MAHLTRDPIDVPTLLAGVASGGDGGYAAYVGVVRDNQDGRAVLWLEYEAHEPMAERQIEALIARAQSRWPLGEVRILHRLGRLAIGEPAVAIAVAAPHRDAALEACRWLIDTLKSEVPIFKKERHADGETWVGDAPPR
ncbi:MAG TPA: molybdenum cofactor biosynthesis protein MoaE [Candidatus Dormibacteraeota bacterium]|jgi:molybdopterin synthase catalytic subunit|nr:molybdenum cofactor biosynthesis protein MoaE [Candidatus Dormibacteraeota bacterium]